MSYIVGNLGIGSLTKRILLGVIATLLASQAWAAGASQTQDSGGLVRVSRAGRSSLVAVFEVPPSARLVVPVPDARYSPATRALFLREGGAEPVTAKCAFKRARGSYSVRSCSGAGELEGFSAKLGEVARLNLDAALDPSLKGIDSPEGPMSPEGDYCRANCHYQWSWAILACWLWNPTPGCYEMVNQFYVACVFRCPL